MTYEYLLERLISDGVSEVQSAYADPDNHHKRDGAIEGFEACRGKDPTELVALWHAEQRDVHRLMHAKSDIKEYWKQVYRAAQVEFVLNVISVGLGQSLLAHLPTARGAMKYAEIVGVTTGALS